MCGTLATTLQSKSVFCAQHEVSGKLEPMWNYLRSITKILLDKEDFQNAFHVMDKFVPVMENGRTVYEEKFLLQEGQTYQDMVKMANRRIVRLSAEQAILNFLEFSVRAKKIAQAVEIGKIFCKEHLNSLLRSTKTYAWKQVLETLDLLCLLICDNTNQHYSQLGDILCICEAIIETLNEKNHPAADQQEYFLWYTRKYLAGPESDKDLLDKVNGQYDIWMEKMAGPST